VGEGEERGKKKKRSVRKLLQSPLQKDAWKRERKGGGERKRDVGGQATHVISLGVSRKIEKK